MENKIDYEKFMKDWSEVTYGCLVCKYENICLAGDECNFELDFEKLVKEVNEDQLPPVSYYLIKENYYIENSEEIKVNEQEN